MSRKTATIVITDDGRDKGKTFILTELSAMKAERWATRALLAMARGGVQLPPNIASAGLAGIAVVGIHALSSVQAHDVEPLMDEMMTCVHIQTVPGHTRALIEDDVEEIQTILRLRDEVITLHVGFSVAAALSELTVAKPAAELSPRIRTSRARSPR